MSDLEQRLAEARGSVHLRWSDERAQSVARGVVRVRRRRAATRTLAGATLALAALALVVVRVRGASSRGEPTAATHTTPALTLPDGTRVTPATLDARVRWVERSGARVVASVDTGAARFEVAHAAERLFRVEAGAVSVQVLGTVFRVERRGAGAASPVRVAVESGRVRVFWGARFADLGGGESGEFPRAEGAPSAGVAASAEGSSAEAPARPVLPAVMEPLTASAEHSGSDAGVRPVRRESALALMGAADDARAHGRGDESLALLRRAAALGASDRSAPLAAYTLGRRLFEEQHDPRGAAGAFAQYRALAPGGPLAESALWYEVECWSAAHETARLRERAREYLERYPHGHHSDRVRTLAGAP